MARYMGQHPKEAGGRPAREPAKHIRWCVFARQTSPLFTLNVSSGLTNRRGGLPEERVQIKKYLQIWRLRISSLPAVRWSSWKVPLSSKAMIGLPEAHQVVSWC